MSEKTKNDLLNKDTIDVPIETAQEITRLCRLIKSDERQNVVDRNAAGQVLNYFYNKIREA